MSKKVIGASRAPALQAVGQAWQEHVFFSHHGLGRQANPAIHASYAPAQVVAPAEAPASTGVQAQCGFECVTLLLQGALEARDSTGHAHTLTAGDVLWSGAGRGLLREIRHDPDWAQRGGTLELVSFWVNLPAQYKQTEPHCQHLPAARLPELPLPEGAGSVRVIAGEYGGQTGPAETATPLQLWDLHLHGGHTVTLPLPQGWYGVLLVLQGRASAPFWPHAIEAPQLVFLGDAGQDLRLDVVQDARMVLLCSQPLPEPIAAFETLVMNTPEQLAQARQDLAEGRFGTLG